MPSFLIYRLAGFFSAFPFFVIPSWKILYINQIEKFNIPENIIHPSYTFSLGIAAPINLSICCIVFGLLVLKKKLEVRINIYQFSILIFSSVYFLLTSQSIKSLGFLFSLVLSFFLIHFTRVPEGRAFINYHIQGLCFFIIAHALSLSLDGQEFSKHTEGISIFGLEIYQALVSYPAVIAAFFGFIIVSPASFLGFFKIKNNRYLNYLFLIIFLFILLYVATFLSRRASFVVIGFSLFIYVFGRSIDLIGKWKSFFSAIIILLVFFILIRTFLFSGIKAFDFQNMVLPRLNLYVKVLNDIFSSNPWYWFWGHEEGWATHHNTFIDIIAHSGFIGLFLFLLCLISIGYSYRQFIKGLMYKGVELNSVIMLLIFCLIFDNFINCAFSTPYYSVSIFIIFLGFLLSYDERTSSDKWN